MVTRPPAPEAHEEHPKRRAERFARIRRLKQMLRFMPRRAMMHKYPLVGRFAAMARKRAYLWSLKPTAIRPALYAGSILSLLPVMGIQLPIAFILSLLLRGNFMVMGGLQFITNPFTAAPIYYATHELGAGVIRFAGFGEAPRSATPGEPILPLSKVASGAVEPPFLATPPPPKAAPASRTRRIATAFNALIVGGIISGAILGLILDVLYRLYWQHHTHVRPRPQPPVHPIHPRPRTAPPPSRTAPRAPDPRSD